MDRKIFNFAGFNSLKVLEYDIDDSDIHILSYLLLMQTFDNLEKVEKDNNIYTYLTYEKIIEDNPTLKIQRRGLENRTSNLRKKGLIDIVSKCIPGSVIKKTYFRVTNKTTDLMFTFGNEEYINYEPKPEKTNVIVVSEDTEIVEQWELDFQRFYKAYPKKQDKQNVIKWFKKNKPTEILMKKILDALEKFKKTEQWTKDKGKFIPMPSTWLNNKRWEDEIISKKSALDEFLEKSSGVEEVF